MLSPLFHNDASSASVYFPARVYMVESDSVILDDANIVVDLDVSGAIVYMELFNPPHLPDYYPLPFIYDARHDTYDMFFLPNAPRAYAVRSTDHDDIDLIYDTIDAVIGMRVCNASVRLPNCVKRTDSYV